MFRLSKKILPLTEVFPSDYVDIHSHLLPGIDDGAKKLEDSLSLITKMQLYGINHFVTTPHISEVWPNTNELIDEKLVEVNEMLIENNIDITLRAAAEHKVDDLFIELLKKKELRTINGKYVLFELGFFNAPIHIHEIIFEMELAGYIPILAHPERYNFYHNNFDELKRLKRSCLFQLDLLSLVGHFGEPVKKMAFKLLQHNMIDVAATDTHNNYHLELLKDIGIRKNAEVLKLILKKSAIFKTV